MYGSLHKIVYTSISIVVRTDDVMKLVVKRNSRTQRMNNHDTDTSIRARPGPIQRHRLQAFSPHACTRQGASVAYYRLASGLV